MISNMPYTSPAVNFSGIFCYERLSGVRKKNSIPTDTVQLFQQPKLNLDDSAWRIIPVSKWLVTPMYKPFMSLGRGTTLLTTYKSWDDPPSGETYLAACFLGLNGAKNPGCLEFVFFVRR